MIGTHTCTKWYTHREKASCEDEGRDQGNASTNQETPKVAGKPLEAKTDLEQSLPYKEPALWAPSSWTSGLQNYEAINVTSDP